MSVDSDTIEGIMKQWDSWREYIANGGLASWPRDAFEALLDHYDIPPAAQQSVEADAVFDPVCRKCGDALTTYELICCTCLGLTPKNRRKSA